MRVPVPDRFAAKPALLFIASLFAVQLLVGTDLLFCVLTAAYVGLFVLGFNAAGGLLYPSGAFIFFNGTMTAIFGLVFKCFLGEPGEKFLLSPITSMLAYCGGMGGMALAAFLTTRLRPKRGLLAHIGAGEMMKRSAIGCLFFGIFVGITTNSAGEGTVGSAFRQINHFIQMAILLATAYEIHRSNGKRSTNWIVWAGGAWYLGTGLITFGKEGMFLGTLTWAVAAVALGYDFRPKQLLFMGIAGFLLVYYLVPYSQYVRNYKTGVRSQDLQIALQYLGDLGETRRLFIEQDESHDITGEPHLFGKPEGFFDRMNMLAFDDALIQYTDNGYVYGILPTLESYANIVPHFLWPSKPSFAYGNDFGRELGVITEDDTSTGISFSPIGDAYHEATWFGVLGIWPVIAFLFFFFTDSLTGSARKAPWALLPISLVSHTAPEGLMQGTIFLTTYGIVSLVVIVLFSRYVLPAITAVFTGTGRGRLGTFTPAGTSAAGPVA